MRTWVGAVADAVGIGVFAAIGRASHAESLGPLGIAETAWPFWAGAAAGWLVSRAWRGPGRLPVGAIVWGATLVGGMVLRWLSGAGVQVAFVIVAGVTLALILLGWRAVRTFAGRRPALRRASA